MSISQTLRNPRIYVQYIGTHAFAKNLFPSNQPVFSISKSSIYICMPVNSVTLGRLMAAGCGIGGVEKGWGGGSWDGGGRKEGRGSWEGDR